LLSLRQMTSPTTPASELLPLAHLVVLVLKGRTVSERAVWGAFQRLVGKKGSVKQLRAFDAAGIEIHNRAKTAVTEALE
jgi:hypothetical protein